MRMLKFKKSIQLATVFLALLVSLAGLVFTDKSIAWFAKNKAVTANGISVNLNLPTSIVAETSFYEITQKKENILTFTALGPNKKPELPPYTVLDETGRYLLMKLSIKNLGNTPETMVLSANTSTNYYMDENHLLLTSLKDETDGTLKANTGTCPGCELGEHTYQNSLASIVQFAIIDSATESEGNVTIDMSTVSSYEKLPFEDTDGTTKISPSVNLKNNIPIAEAGGLTPDDAPADICTIWVLIAYDTAAINKIYSLNIGMPSMSDFLLFVADVHFGLTLSNDNP